MKRSFSSTEKPIKRPTDNHNVYNDITKRTKEIQKPNGTIQSYLFKDRNLFLVEKRSNFNDRIAQGQIFNDRFAIIVTDEDGTELFSRPLWSPHYTTITWPEFFLENNRPKPPWIPQKFHCNQCKGRIGLRAWYCLIYNPARHGYYIQNAGRELLIQFFETSMLVFDLTTDVIEEAITEIRFCSNHLPPDRIVEIGSDLDGSICFANKKYFNDSTVDLSGLDKVYSFNLFDWRWIEHSTKLCGLPKNSVVKLEYFQRAHHRIYLMTDIHSFSYKGPLNVKDTVTVFDPEQRQRSDVPYEGKHYSFVSLCLKTMVWSLHSFYILEPYDNLKILYVADGELFFAFEKSSDRSLWYLFKWNQKVLSLRDRAAQEVFRTVENLDAIKNSLPKNLLNRYV